MAVNGDFNSSTALAAFRRRARIAADAFREEVLLASGLIVLRKQ